ncbi:hypothetical protein [Porphyrobacter sp. GA68]|uniref:hypothetical protein n=1 Tax=Porphyrobacter sp. GA68 TaxID=2883480 RepID=UPI001D18318F|nr:hypothetical protein [Porphyrobacter sp. GA68]
MFGSLASLAQSHAKLSRRSALRSAVAARSLKLIDKARWRTPLVAACLAVGGLGSPAAATTVVMSAPDCTPPSRTVVIPGSGSVSGFSFACPAGMAYSAGGGAGIDVIAQHTHSLVIQSPAQGGAKGPFTVTSGPFTVTDGFAISTLLDGFASFQGNAGSDDVFTWSATLTATFLGGSSSVTSSGSINSSPQQRIREFDLKNFPRVRGTDVFSSTLTVTTSGPGELHLGQTGIATLAAVPESATWLMMIFGFWFVGLRLRRGKTNRTYLPGRLAHAMS